MKKLGDILKENSNATYAEFWRVHNIWQRAMTKNIAEISTPVKITDGLLTVIICDNIWLTELNYMKEEIKEQLALHGLDVKEVTFKYKPVYEKVAVPKTEPLKISPMEQVSIDEIAKSIDNELLKTHFIRAMRAYFTRFSHKEFLTTDNE